MGSPRIPEFRGRVGGLGKPRSERLGEGMRSLNLGEGARSEEARVPTPRESIGEFGRPRCPRM